MAENILQIIEDNLLQLAKKYQTFLKNEDLKYEDIKDYDSELNDIMERYKTLKSIQSTVSSQDLSVLYDEYNTIFQDFKSKYESGYFMPKDGVDGVNGKDGVDGKDGLSAYELAVNGGYVGTVEEWLESLKGSANVSFTYPIPFEKIGTETTKLNDELARLSQGLGEIKGQIGSINLNELSGEFQSIKGTISSFSNQLETIWAFIQGGEVYNAVTQETTQFDGLLNIFNSLNERLTALDGGGNVVIEVPDNSSISFINLYENDNLSFQFAKLNEDELLIRTSKVQMSSNYNVFKTNVYLDVEEIEKIEYKILTALDVPVLDGNLTVTNNIPMFDLSSFTLNADTVYPTRDNTMQVEFNEKIGNVYEVTGDYVGQIEEFLFLFVIVVDGCLYIVSNENTSASFYHSNIKITLKTGHTSIIEDNPMVEAETLIPQSSGEGGIAIYNSLRLLDFNLSEYGLFMSDVSDLFGNPPPSGGAM